MSTSPYLLVRKLPLKYLSALTQSIIPHLHAHETLVRRPNLRKRVNQQSLIHKLHNRLHEVPLAHYKRAAFL